ncbi:Zeta toxin [bacterium]|nr:Zeta toxin [bacterium]|tara:strand:- start:1393 stop:2103 length:711 start_codon:yes stop_codon:yes gene_type:complete
MSNISDADIEAEAIVFAQKNKKEIAKRLVDSSIYKPEDHPVSVFMAGSPGAGKTESAKALIQKISNNDLVLHIDPDELRVEFEAYNGKNSSLFQGATSIVVDKIHDLALKQKQSFVFDGTLTNFNRAVDNISRSLKKSRDVFIVYVYQDPIQAWEFVKIRASKDGRIIPREAFIEQYFLARENVNKIKAQFVGNLQVDLIVKNIDGTDFKYHENISKIDSYIPEEYSSDKLHDILK